MSEIRRLASGLDIRGGEADEMRYARFGYDLLLGGIGFIRGVHYFPFSLARMFIVAVLSVDVEGCYGVCIWLSSMRAWTFGPVDSIILGSWLFVLGLRVCFLSCHGLSFVWNNDFNDIILIFVLPNRTAFPCFVPRQLRRGTEYISERKGCSSWTTLPPYALLYERRWETQYCPLYFIYNT